SGAADIKLEERNPGSGRKKSGRLLGREKPVAPALNNVSRHCQLAGVEYDRTPVNVVLIITSAGLLRRSANKIAHPIEHDVVVIGIAGIKATGEQTDN